MQTTNKKSDLNGSVEVTSSAVLFAWMMDMRAAWRQHVLSYKPSEICCKKVPEQTTLLMSTLFGMLSVIDNENSFKCLRSLEH